MNTHLRKATARQANYADSTDDGLRSIRVSRVGRCVSRRRTYYKLVPLQKTFANARRLLQHPRRVRSPEVVTLGVPRAIAEGGQPDTAASIEEDPEDFGAV